MHRASLLLFVPCLCSVSCKTEHPPARFSLPLGKWCVAQSQRVDSSFAVAQATDAIAGHYLSAEYKLVRIENDRPSCGLPNKCLKLTAPVVCGRISFVSIPVRR